MLVPDMGSLIQLVRFLGDLLLLLLLKFDYITTVVCLLGCCIRLLILLSIIFNQVALVVLRDHLLFFYLYLVALFIYLGALCRLS